MKIAFVVVGFLMGYMTHAVIDLRQEYRQSVALAEANCNVFALSDPKIEMEPALIDCKLIVDDAFLLRFEVNEAAGVYVECLRGGAVFSSGLSPRECSLYIR